MFDSVEILLLLLLNSSVVLLLFVINLLTEVFSFDVAEEEIEEVADLRTDVFPRGLISMATDSRSIILPDDCVRLCLAFFASLAASIMAETEKD